jgi:hypothetical protein
MTKELNRAVSMHSVLNSVISKFSDVFQKECRTIETLDDLLQKNSDIPLKPPPELRRMRNEKEIFWA